MINPEKIIKALLHFIETGHKSYQDVNIDEQFFERCKTKDQQGYNLITREEEN